jgi:TctA family transporter
MDDRDSSTQAISVKDARAERLRVRRCVLTSFAAAPSAFVPGFGVSQAAQMSASFLLRTSHAGHSHVPAVKLAAN